MLLGFERHLDQLARLVGCFFWSLLRNVGTRSGARRQEQEHEQVTKRDFHGRIPPTARSNSTSACAASVCAPIKDNSVSMSFRCSFITSNSRICPRRYA